MVFSRYLEMDRHSSVHRNGRLHCLLISRLPAFMLLPLLWLSPAADAEGPHYYRAAPRASSALIKTDIAVYGGTPGGAAAAIQAARMGRKVVLLSFDRHVGGMTSGGLTATDIGNRDSIGGIALEFYTKMGKISGFRPTEAESLYLKLLKEAGVWVLFERCLESVVMQDNRVRSATMETGETVEADVFIDASYEGDLMAAANVSYHVGRESTRTYGESIAGAWFTAEWKNVYQFCRLPIDPFVKPGDPASGLLPEISSEPSGNLGDGDAKVQAYNFRMFLTNEPDRLPYPKPTGYDDRRYGLLARFLHADPRIQWRLTYTVTPMTDGPVQLRPGDCNNAGSFSTDYVGGAYRWPDGVYQPGSSPEPARARRGLKMPLRELYALRERIFQDHLTYQQGLMYFLANDSSVPAELRARMNRFGLDPAEFGTTEHWPHQLYVREARRMVAEYVVTQHDCESETVAPDSVGLASYNMDSHFCQRMVVTEKGRQIVRNEGGLTKHCPRPYPVSYRAIVPKKAECANLLVPVCASATHIAYASIRMEPVFMILGQSAGTAAALACAEHGAVQDVPYKTLRQRLLADGQRLEFAKK